VNTEPAAFATQQKPPARSESGCFRIPQRLCGRLSKIGAVDARQPTGNVSLPGEASLQRYGPRSLQNAEIGPDFAELS
jgi:hypothetical protein